MLKPAHFGRYKDLAILLRKYGLKDFKLDTKPPIDSPDEAIDDRPTEPDVRARARAFAEKLKSMGPTFVKFGQILSTRPDIVPPEYVEALEELQDAVEPFSYGDVEHIIETELGVRISKAFESFDATPLAAASLGQVHRGVLRNGRDIVVKVQRPNIRETIENDLQVFEEIAQFLDSHSSVARKLNLVGSVAQARKTLTNELDYRLEAKNIDLFRRNLAEFEEIYVPKVVHDYTTGKILTTEFISGKKVSKLSPLALTEHDYSGLAAVLTRAYLKQICVDGVWHSDPHPGNVFLSDGKLILLDFGMVSRIGRDFQDQIVKLLLSITENRGTDAAEVCIQMGTIQEGFSRSNFVRDISELTTTYHDADPRHTNTGQLIFTVIRLANANELQVPAELAMLAKTLLHLDGITKKLDPDYNPRQVIRDYAEQLVSKKVAQKFHPRNFYAPLLDLNELIIELPKKSREIIDQVTSGRVTVNIRVAQAGDFLKGMHKIANRITVGLVIAALIVGSSLMLRVPSRLTIFGYPALAMLGYLFASVIGFYLVISTLMQDRRDRERARGNTEPM